MLVVGEGEANDDSRGRLTALCALPSAPGVLLSHAPGRVLHAAGVAAVLLAGMLCVLQGSVRVWGWQENRCLAAIRSRMQCTWLECNPTS